MAQSYPKYFFPCARDSGVGFTGLTIFATSELEQDVDAVWASSAPTKKRKANTIASVQSLRMAASKEIMTCRLRASPRQHLRFYSRTGSDSVSYEHYPTDMRRGGKRA